MKRIVLVRHATAVNRGGEKHDFHRRLKKRGRKEAVEMSLRVSRSERPQLLVSSPADRASETARIFAETLGYPRKKIVLWDELYGGLTPEEFLTQVHRLDDQFDSVMLFGHDPCFTEFARFMIPRFKGTIPKCGVVMFKTRRKSWANIKGGDGESVTVLDPIDPRVLKEQEKELLKELTDRVQESLIGTLQNFKVDRKDQLEQRVSEESGRLARRIAPFVRVDGRSRKPSGAAPVPAEDTRREEMTP